MKLTTDQVAAITDEDGVYDCRLITQQFAYKVLGEQVSPLGNIVCFEAPIKVGPLVIEHALVLAGEIPSTNMFGAVCLQRLYATQLGSLLSVMTGKDFYVEDSCIFTNRAQSSLVISNKVKDSVMFNIVFPIQMNMNTVEFYMLDLNELLMEDFKHNAIESFNFLTKSIFLETCRDNF